MELHTADGGQAREVLAQPKRIALLSVLALHSRVGSVQRDTLLGMLWPELDATHARNALSQALYHLRRSLGPEALTNKGSNALSLDTSHLWCDAVAFEKAVAAHADKDALDLYRGELLPGFFVTNVPEFEHWLDGQQVRLRDMADDCAASWPLRSPPHHTRRLGGGRGGGPGPERPSSP